MRNLGPVKLNPSTQWVYDVSLSLVCALMHCQSAVGSDCADLSRALGIVALWGSLFPSTTSPQLWQELVGVEVLLPS